MLISSNSICGGIWITFIFQTENTSYSGLAFTLGPHFRRGQRTPPWRPGFPRGSSHLVPAGAQPFPDGPARTTDRPRLSRATCGLFTRVPVTLSDLKSRLTREKKCPLSVSEEKRTTEHSGPEVANARPPSSPRGVGASIGGLTRPASFAARGLAVGPPESARPSPPGPAARGGHGGQASPRAGGRRAWEAASRRPAAKACLGWTRVPTARQRHPLLRF